MVRLWMTLGLVAVLVLGFGRIWRALSRHFAERAEVENFIETFTRYVNSRGDDRQAYGEMLERSYRIQELLGPAGVLAKYLAPFRRYVVTNYDIILNALPAMQRDFERGISRSDYQPLVGEALVRYMGLSADYIREKQREARNPVAWFREGVAAILLLPVWLLQSLGVISETGSARFAGSALFRILNGLFALIGLVGSVFTIVLGWGAMKELIAKLLGR